MTPISTSENPTSTSSPAGHDDHPAFPHTRVNVWIEAARPRTLSAGIVPVVVGAAAAHRLIPWRFVAALVVGASIQVGVNYANDYFDGVKGVDTPARVGPRRATAAGLVAPVRMRTAMLLAFAVAALAGATLALAVEPVLLLVGAACFVAALAYSGGPRPYASVGMGELFVFVFFGLVATVGSAYVQEERIAPVAVAAAVPVGLLAVAILVVNNLRDIGPDATSGKVTLAVRLGEPRTARLYELILLAAAVGVVITAVVDRSGWPLIGLMVLVPAALRARRLVVNRELLHALGATAQLELAVGAALALGLWLS